MDLADKIRRYFFDNFTRLRPARQFHFASRMASWEDSDEAISKLVELKEFMLPARSPKLLSNLLQSPLGMVYADGHRKKYFNKYSWLFGINKSLFHVRHLKEIYAIDLRDDFLRLVNEEKLLALARQLMEDRQALKWLSSFAVSYLYLLDKLYGWDLGSQAAVDLDIKRVYNPDDSIQLNLLIYYVTHCVIAESNFYGETIPLSKMAKYQKMLRLIDDLVENRDDIKLDAKFEYMVASRICGREAPIQKLINQRMEQQLSSEGYIIDISADKNSWQFLNSINVSEHRNALFIMSNSSYQPYKGPFVLS